MSYCNSWITRYTESKEKYEMANKQYLVSDLSEMRNLKDIIEAVIIKFENDNPGTALSDLYYVVENMELSDLNDLDL
jgi:hypothetical protein